jgi:hypothetical protein
MKKKKKWIELEGKGEKVDEGLRKKNGEDDEK